MDGDFKLNITLYVGTQFLKHFKIVQQSFQVLFCFLADFYQTHMCYVFWDAASEVTKFNVRNFIFGDGVIYNIYIHT